MWSSAFRSVASVVVIFRRCRLIISASLAKSEERAELHKQVKRTEEKLELRIRSLGEEVEADSAGVKKELTKTKKLMRDESETLRGQLLDELNKHFRSPLESKLAKEEMSEILLEFGMRIRGLEFVNEFPQLPQNTQQRE